MNKHANKPKEQTTAQNHPSPEVSGRAQRSTPEAAQGMLAPLEKYQVWEETIPGMYRLTPCDTLMDCISAPKSGRWFVTKGVSLAVMDQDDLMAPTEQLRAHSQPQIQTHEQGDITEKLEETFSTEEDEALRRYLAGT
jgi:hypothetical protein